MFNLVDYLKTTRKRYTDLFKDDVYFDAFIKSVADVAMEYQTGYQTLFSNAFNIDESYGGGLDWIGNIVNQDRELIGFNDSIYIGDDENDTALSSKFLSDREYRNVLKARILSNNSTGTTDEFLQIISLLAFSDENTISVTTHGVIQIKFISDTYGLLEYFLSRVEARGNIIPVPLGYRIEVVYQ